MILKITARNVCVAPASSIHGVLVPEVRVPRFQVNYLAGRTGSARPLPPKRLKKSKQKELSAPKHNKPKGKKPSASRPGQATAPAPWSKRRSLYPSNLSKDDKEWGGPATSAGLSLEDDGSKEF